MKWRIYKLGKLKVSMGELRTLHDGTGYNSGCGHSFTGEYITVYWKGKEKWKRIINLEHRLKLK